MRNRTSHSRTSHSRTSHSLEAYVAGHCAGCEQTRVLCAQVASLFPGLVVRLVDLEQDPAKKPATVVAVPAYVVDGQVLFLGNPRADELFSRLERLLDKER